MAALAVASIVHWATNDPYCTILKQNWALRPGTAIETAKAIFYGVCVAFLGVTGMSCTFLTSESYDILLAYRVRMHAVLYRGYPSEGLLLDTTKPDYHLCPSQHCALFPCVRIASSEHSCRRYERLVRPW